MSTEKPVREITEEWNAKAKAEGVYLDQEPGSLPNLYEGSILDIPRTQEAEERIARLRAQRLEREKTAKHATEQVQGAPNKVIAAIQDQCLNAIINDAHPNLPTK